MAEGARSAARMRTGQTWGATCGLRRGWVGKGGVGEDIRSRGYCSLLKSEQGATVQCSLLHLLGAQKGLLHNHVALQEVMWSFALYARLI